MSCMVRISDCSVFSNNFFDKFRVENVDSAPGCERALKDVMAHDMPVAYVSREKHVAFAFPPVFFPDLYYTHADESDVISDNLFDLAQEVGICTFDEEQIDLIRTRGFCTPSKSPLEGIFRFEGYSYYPIREGRIGERQPLPFEPMRWNNDDESYEDFKRHIDESIDACLERSTGRKIHLLLSGGADSRLIFLSLLRRGIEFEVDSLLYSPTAFSDNVSDAAKARELCAIAGVPHNMHEVDANKLEGSYLAPVVEGMPCCAHSTIGFKVPIDQFAKSDVVIWTGQNMDSLYNMGATQRLSLDKHAIAQMFKRFYLSEEYARTLPDVEGEGSVLARVVAATGLTVFRKGYHDRSMNLPANAAQLARRFELSDDYVVLRPSDDDERVLSKSITAHQLKEKLFQGKLAFIRGGDAQSISTSARLNNSSVIYPFSTTSMIQFFYAYHLTVKDTLSPKRFVYRFVKELARQIDPRLSSYKVSKSGRDELCKTLPLDLYDFSGKQLETNLYQDMMKCVGGGQSKIYQGRAQYEHQTQLLRLYWIEVLKQLLEFRNLGA